MRILIVSNLFPPHFIGGYELGCAQVAEGLARRGHEVQVLASSFGIDRARTGYGNEPKVEVQRVLQHDFNGWLSRQTRRFKRVSRDEWNGRALAESVISFGPDVIMLWNLGGITREFVEIAPALKPTAFFISDDWLAKWSVGKNASELSEFDSRGAMFCSEYLRNFTAQSGWNLENASVVHWGVETTQFFPRDAPKSAPRKLLFCGQIVPHKGAHIALEAFLALAETYPDLEISFAGGSRHRKYLQRLQVLAERSEFGARVQWLGQMAREELPQLLREHDIFLLPSQWDEPFSITLLEAMASGLACVSTTTGGSREIVRHGENTLAFEAGNAADCATQIKRILQEPALGVRLGAAARQTVERNYSIERMTDQIEAILTRFVAHTSQ